MKTANLLLPVVAMLFLGLISQAQETDWETFDSPELFQVEYFKFNAGKSDEAIKIIEDYFSEANRLADIPIPVLELEVLSDDYDYMVVWPMQEGVEHLNWQTSPTNTEWYRAFVIVMGSEENAKAIIEEFDACVGDSKIEMAQN